MDFPSIYKITEPLRRTNTQKHTNSPDDVKNWVFVDKTMYNEFHRLRPPQKEVARLTI